MWGVGCQVGEGELKYDRQVRYLIPASRTLVTAYTRQPSSMVTHERLAFKMRAGDCVPLVHRPHLRCIDYCISFLQNIPSRELTLNRVQVGCS